MGEREKILRDSLNRYYFNMTVSDICMLAATSRGNLSYNSVMYLDIISYEEGCTVSSLAETLHISKPAVTAKVNELVKQGFVVKRQSDRDKRVFYLSVSDEVKAVLDDYDRPLEKAVRKVVEKYGDEQIGIFCEILAVFSAEFAGEK